MQILAIDDDPPLLSFYGEFLADDGHDVRLARHGAEGLAILKNFRPDLILVDLEMPVMSGEEFLHALDNGIGLSRVPVLVVSGSATRLRALSRPGTGLLRKPFAFEELEKMVHDLVTVSGSTPEARPA